MDIEILKTKTLQDLRAIAKLAGVKSATTYKKNELLQLLYDMSLNAEAKSDTLEQAPPNSQEPPISQEPQEEDAPVLEETGEEHRETESAPEKKHMPGSKKGWDKDSDTSGEAGSDESKTVEGILEVHTDGYGFLRSENYLPGNKDIYISVMQIRKFNLKTGDKVRGVTRAPKEGERLLAMLYIESVNDRPVGECLNRRSFDELTPLFPDKRYRLEND